MNNVINLNKFRKKKNREADEKLAEENRAKHGRTKTEKRNAAKEDETLRAHVDGHKRDDENT